MLSPRPRVVITHRVHDEVLAVLASHCDVVANQTPVTLPRAEVLERAGDASALIAFMPDTIDAAFLDACPSLQIVAGALRGYDNFDIAACTERGIWFTIVPDLLAEATAELGIGLLIGLVRRIPEGDAFVRSSSFRGWQPHLYGRGVAGRTIGIAGMGQLGRAFAARLVPFGARVTYTDVRRLADAAERELAMTYVTLDDMIRDVDVLVLTLPLTDQTHHLIDAVSLATMRVGATIVNLARGSLVDESAIAAALEAGTLAGYAADVYEFEDWARTDRPKHIPQSLLAEKTRTLFTPHLGSAVESVRLAIELEAANAVLAVLRGEDPPNAVNAVTR